MRKKHLLVVGLMASISIFSLFGCGNSESSEPTTTTSVAESEDETSTEETTTDEVTTEEVKVGHFDPADVCKNISINGKLVEFPWTLNKLGEEYEFSDVSDDVDANGYYGATISCNNKNAFTVCIKEDNEVDRDSLIVSTLLDIQKGIQVYDLNENSKEEDLIRVLGQPSEKRSNVIAICYVYKTEEMHLTVWFIQDTKKIDNIYIDVSKSWN